MTRVSLLGTPSGLDLPEAPSPGALGQGRVFTMDVVCVDVRKQHVHSPRATVRLRVPAEAEKEGLWPVFL